MTDREFWVEMRRGFRTTIAAIDHARPEPHEFWSEVRRGLTITARAIEYQYRLPVGSTAVIGQQQPDEPPAVPLARSSTGGIE